MTFAVTLVVLPTGIFPDLTDVVSATMSEPGLGTSPLTTVMVSTPSLICSPIPYGWFTP